MTAPLEAVEQRTLAEYLDLIGVLYTAVPMGGHMSPVMGARRRGMGAKAGVPDVLVFTAPPRHPTARGVAIELKREGTAHLAGGRPSPEQAWWLAALEAEGWLTRCCHGASDAMRWLRGLGWP
jgi:hypothetical protein